MSDNQPPPGDGTFPAPPPPPPSGGSPVPPPPPPSYGTSSAPPPPPPPYDASPTSGSPYPSAGYPSPSAGSPYPSAGSPYPAPPTGPYNPTGPAAPGYGPAPAGNNQKAVAGLVVSILGIVFAFCCSFLGVILGGVGAVLGHLAKQEIAASADQRSMGLAKGAFITGLVAAGLSIVMIILSLVLNIGSLATTGMFSN